MLTGDAKAAQEAMDGFLKHRQLCGVLADGGLQVGLALVRRAQLAHDAGNPELARELLTEWHLRWPSPDKSLQPVVQGRALAKTLGLRWE